MKKPPSKVALNWTGCPNQPRNDFSYYKYVPRLIHMSTDLWVEQDTIEHEFLAYLFKNYM